ncbi:MAG: TetR/AcrR family transcriptional regulator [Ilumatobacteraceae bacterium]
MFEIAEDPSAAVSPRERRRAETREEIVAAAWELARRDGLAGISLRELGKRVGLKASSLYAYFDSKGALYDEMYRRGYRDLLELARRWVVEFEAADDRRAAFTSSTREFFQLCIDDPVRYQLLFQRTIPGWEPSTDSYAVAVTYVDQLRSSFELVGLNDEHAIDMWTAVLTGLTSQQLSNDPGGDRWFRLVEDAVEMFFRHYPSTIPTTVPSTDEE